MDQWAGDDSSRGIVPTRVIPALQRTRLLPQAYRIGLLDVSVESEIGRPAYLLGQNYLGGRWYYFPVAASSSSPCPFCCCSFFLRSVPLLANQCRKTRCFDVPVILFMATSAISGMNIGLRHIFPVIPLLAIFGAAGIWNVPLNRNSVMGALIAVLLVAHAASSLHAFPNYISYGNELWGGPENAYKYVADSNADWGQAQKLAASYLQANETRVLFYDPVVSPTGKVTTAYRVPPFRIWNVTFHPCRLRHTHREF